MTEAGVRPAQKEVCVSAGGGEPHYMSLSSVSGRALHGAVHGRTRMGVCMCGQHLDGGWEHTPVCVCDAPT